MPLECPRCGGKEFEDLDSGPDTYEDDIFYISNVCAACKLYYSGWTGKWLVDCDNWRDEDFADEYKKED